MIDAIKSFISTKLGRWIVGLGFLVFIVSIAIGFSNDAESFAGNFLAEVAGVAMSVLVTLFVVEIFLEYRDEEKWKLANRYVAMDLANLGSRLRTDILQGFSLEKDFSFSVETASFTKEDWESIPAETRGNQKLISPEAIAIGLEEANILDWRDLPDEIEELESRTYRVLHLYAPRLSAEQFAAFVEIKSGLSAMVILMNQYYYSVQYLDDRTRQELRKIFGAKQLSEALGGLPPVTSDSRAKFKKTHLPNLFHLIAPDIFNTLVATHKLTE